MKQKEKFRENSQNPPASAGGTSTSDEFLEKMQAHLAGLEAGRPKWHKVADGDLPKENKRYLCKIKEFVGGGISYECFDYDTEYSSWKNACGDVIEWCEIPTFDKE